MEAANASSAVKSSTSAPIDAMPDSLLAKIFSYLPFKDRYLLCLVSGKWAEASRVRWTDITFLNLSSIPRAMVNAILGLCPNIGTIEANGQIILLEMKPSLSINENVHTMKLRDTKLALMDLDCGDVEPSYELVFDSFLYHFKRFPKLAELTLQNVSFAIPLHEDGKAAKHSFVSVGFRKLLDMPDTTAVALRRLVLTDSGTLPGEHSIFVALSGMKNLECLYLEQARNQDVWRDFELPQLRELCVAEIGVGFSQLIEKVAKAGFPKLEVLICTSDWSINLASLAKLITVKFALRVVVVAGRDLLLALKQLTLDMDGAVVRRDPPVELLVTVPRRQLSADSNGATQSQLQIFVGGEFTKHVRFTLPPLNVAKFWRIDCPMPEFLKKPEVAEVFKDVFVAKVIREGPENGLLPWGHPDKPDLFFSTEELLFR